MTRVRYSGERAVAWAPGRSGVRGALGCGAVVALVVAGWAPAVWGLPGEGCLEAVADQQAAGVMAERCGVAVEVLDARTAWETLWALPDGTTRWEMSATAVRAEVGDVWVEIDPTVVVGDEGFEVAAAAVGMVFADGTGEGPLAVVERDGHWLRVDVPFVLPAPRVEGRQLTYGQVAEGVDLVVTVNEDATGFSQVLRFASASALAQVGIADLIGSFVVAGALGVDESGDVVVMHDTDDRRVFSVSEAVMWDSGPGGVVWAPMHASETERGVEVADPRAEAPVEGQEVVLLDGAVGDGLGSSPLADVFDLEESPVWPMYVGQAVSASLHAWTRVNDKFAPKYMSWTDEGVGRCQTNQYMSCQSSPFKQRLMWMFTGLGQVGAANPSDIVSAQFTAYGTHSYNCTPQPVSIYRVGDFNASTTWPGGGLWDFMDHRTVAHRAACGSGLEPRWIEFDATAQARAIANAGTAVGSIGMQTNEDSNLHWKRYRNDAKFTVVFNRPPNAPTGAGTVSPASACVTGGSRPVINSARPTLRATISDPDGGNVSARFEIYRVSTGARVWGPHATSQLASGTAHSVHVPANVQVDNVAYRWRVWGVDGHGRVGPHVQCEYLVDTKAPNLPTVTPVQGQAGVYPENAWGGGLNKTGRFTFGNGGSGDVVSYRYSFNNTALTQSAAGAAPTVSFTPTRVGTNTLRVQSVDRAGWTSPVRTYSFHVKIAGRSARWLFDEGSGVTAYDSVGTRHLTRTTAATWTDGLLAEIGFDPSDRALLFDAGKIDSQATSSGPVVASTEDFAVTAIVRVDELQPRSATAISQDGASVSGFSLGYRIHTSCPDGCLSMFMYPTDSVTDPKQAASDIIPQEGHWYGLIGMYDATNKRMGMAACDLGTATEEPSEPPILTEESVNWVNFNSRWQALGDFVVGRGQSGGQAARPWHGAVGEVSVYDGLIDLGEMQRVCSPVTLGMRGAS